MSKCEFHQVQFGSEVKERINTVSYLFDSYKTKNTSHDEKIAELMDAYISAISEAIRDKLKYYSPESIDDSDLMPFFITEWVYARRPFYRVYPGVIEALKKFDVTRIDTFNSTTLSGPVMIELPKGFELTDNEQITNVTNLFMDVHTFNGEKYIFMSPILNGKVEANLAGMYRKTKNLDASIHKLYTKETLPPTFSLIAGLLFLDNQPGLFDPIVLKKDIMAYERATSDEDRNKYIQRAKNRGVIGYEIGKNIPTKSEFAAMKKENEEAVKQGKKIPHIRCGHLHTFWTGQGRSTPKIKYVNATLVNFDGIFEVPNGYYN